MKHVSKIGRGIFNAVIAGTCASFGSLLGKLSGSSEHIDYICGVLHSLKSIYVYHAEEENICDGDIISWIVKAVMVVCMIACNTAGLTFYVKALKSSKSTLPATLTSTSTSFILSAVLGALMFGETTSLLWWMGAVMVVIGLLLVSGEKDLAKKES
ncbi:uncharacterized protein LOC124164002 [Ischnura elegans]|uniref:uncharacterized protein LOC124164002 n=1 Tax=Ischnura elegans TaxID=197161 RepID=UPI001ED88183|nr:uncharacterized protein LOC124164002 [Ischnura elegans]